MQIREISGKSEWENFLSQCKNKTFLQSWNWGEFQKTAGRKIWRFGVYNKEELLAVCLIVKISAKRGRFLFGPHGPIIKNPKYKFQIPNQIQNPKYKILKELLQEIKKIAKQEKCSFVRMAPVWERTGENEKIFQGLGFRQAPIHMHPELSWLLDINISEEQLLTNMRKTTRYLIRQGLKNPDLRVRKSKDLKDVEVFNELYQATVARHRFTPFSLDYLRNELKAFSQDDQIAVFSADYQEECLSSAMIIFWQGIAFYHQGASSQRYPKIPASYLLQWEAIREAKRRGCREYNFWGIAPSDNPRHPWYGLSLFKTGFGGRKKEYLKTQDFVLSPEYWLNYFIERTRKIKRRL